MSRRRHFHNFILLLGSLVFALLCGEIGARIYVGVTGGAPEGAKSLFDRVGMIDLRGHSECGGKGPEVIPHPYFAFVKNPYHPCNQRGAWTNRHGFLNPEEFPEVGESEHFDILILGGSVASLVAMGWDHSVRDSNDIEMLLNQKFRPPLGKSFRVFNGAMDGGSQPLQNAVLMNLGDRFEGVILIDGYNENLHSDYFLMGTPAVSLYLDGFKALAHQVNAGVLVRLARFLKSSSAINWSYLAGLVHGPILNLSVVREMKSLGEDLEKIYYGAASPPESWSHSDLISYNAKKYAQFVLSAQSLSQSMGLKFAHFMQPIRWLYKPLTEKEKSYEKFCNVDFYKQMDSSLESLRQSQGLQSYSLLKLLDGNSGEYYGDHIHFRFSPNGRNEGNYLMAQAIVDKIEKAWGLEAKP